MSYPGDDKRFRFHTLQDNEETMTKICGPIVIFFLTAIVLWIQPELRDSRIVPIFLIAVLLSPMLLEWLVGFRDVFNPSGLIALLLFQFLVISPILSFLNDTYTLSMNDTRSLLSETMWLVVPGVLAFLVGHSIPVGARMGSKISFGSRPLNISRARIVAVLLIAIGLLANIAFLVIALGRGATWETRFSATAGLGYIATIANFLRIGLLLVATISIQRYFDKLEYEGQASKTVPLMTAFLVLAVILSMVLFRGSRGSIIINLFWIAGIVHYTLRRFKRIYILVLVLIGLPALHIYGLYKSFGMRAFSDYWNPSLRAGMEETSKQSMMGVLIGDLGRIHVWMFARQEILSGRFPHTWGNTYAGGSVAFIPRIIWPNRPYGMSETITDMIHGKGKFQATQEKTARVAGLIGEAYINYGWPFILVVMFLYGILVRGVSAWVEDSPLTAAKVFLIPIVTLTLMHLFIWDWVWNVFKTFNLILPVYLTYRFSSSFHQPFVAGERADVSNQPEGNMTCQS